MTAGSIMRVYVTSTAKTTVGHSDFSALYQADRFPLYLSMHNPTRVDEGRRMHKYSSDRTEVPVTLPETEKEGPLCVLPGSEQLLGARE